MKLTYHILRYIQAPFYGEHVQTTGKSLSLVLQLDFIYAAMGKRRREQQGSRSGTPHKDAFMRINFLYQARILQSELQSCLVSMSSMYRIP